MFETITLQGTNISHLQEKKKVMDSKVQGDGIYDMLLPRRVKLKDFILPCEVNYVGSHKFRRVEFFFLLFFSFFWVEAKI